MRLYEENKKSRVLKALQKAMEKDIGICRREFEYFLEESDRFKNDELFKEAERIGRTSAIDIIIFRCLREAIEETDRFNSKRIYDLAIEKAMKESRLLSREELNSLTWGIKNLFREITE